MVMVGLRSVLDAHGEDAGGGALRVQGGAVGVVPGRRGGESGAVGEDVDLVAGVGGERDREVVRAVQPHRRVAGDVAAAGVVRGVDGAVGVGRGDVGLGPVGGADPVEDADADRVTGLLAGGDREGDLVALAELLVGGHGQAPLLSVRSRPQGLVVGTDSSTLSVDSPKPRTCPPDASARPARYFSSASRAVSTAVLSAASSSWPSVVSGTTRVAASTIRSTTTGASSELAVVTRVRAVV